MLVRGREKENNKINESDGRAKKILIIDDETDITYLTKRILEKANYNVIPANSGIEGMKIAEKEKPDLILLDLKLPDINGIEVLNELKENNETKSIPVAIFSVVSEKEVLEMKPEIKIKYDFYIEKPFRKDEFISRIEDITSSF